MLKRSQEVDRSACKFKVFMLLCVLTGLLVRREPILCVRLGLLEVGLPSFTIRDIILCHQPESGSSLFAFKQ